MLQIDQKFLEIPVVHYGKSKSAALSGSTWNLKGIPFHTPVPKTRSENRIGVLDLTRRAHTQRTLHHNTLVKGMNRQFTALGMYAAIKRAADCLIGVQTVCLTVDKIKNNPSLWGNLCLKMNLKLGGINHLVFNNNKTAPVSAFAQIQPNTIVMGADVVHPPTTATDGCPSIAALVASDCPNMFNFPGSMRLNPARQEVLFY